MEEDDASRNGTLSLKITEEDPRVIREKLKEVQRAIDERMRELDPQPVNDVSDFFKQLRDEGKGTDLNRPEDDEERKAMNATNDESTEAFRQMDAESRASVAGFVITD